MSVVICTHDGTEHEWQPGGKCPDAIPAGTWSVRSTADVPVSGGPEVRQQLADELARHQGLRGPMDPERPDVWQNRCVCGWDDGDERTGWRERYRLHIADTLMAHVDRIAAERAAEALRELTWWLTGVSNNGSAVAPDRNSDGVSWQLDVRTPNEASDWFECSIRDRAEAMAAGRQETT